MGSTRYSGVINIRPSVAVLWIQIWSDRHHFAGSGTVPVSIQGLSCMGGGGGGARAQNQVPKNNSYWVWGVKLL
jgi:hypothetical protein